MTNQQEKDLEAKLGFYFNPDSVLVKHKWHQIFYAFGANLMNTCYGLVFCASGFMLPQLEDPEVGFGIDKEQGSWFASIMIAGSCTGAICGGWQSEKFGRRKSLLFDCFVFILSTLACAMAPNFYILLIARVIQGHSMASQFTTSPVYTSEVCQPEVRSITGNFSVACYSFGATFMMTLGACLPWRYAIGTTLIIPLACFVILLLCPESPAWLMAKGRDEDAREALKKLRGANHSDIIDAELFRISTSLKMMKKDNELNEQSESSAKDLLTDIGFLKPLGILLFIFCVGLEWTGLTAIAFYNVPLLMSAGIPLDPYWATVLLNTFRFMLSMLAISFAKKVPRRTTYIFCMFVSTIATSLIGTYFFLRQNDVYFLQDNVYFRMIPLIGIVMLYFCFVFATGNIAIILQSEILPLRGRSFGSGILGLLDNLSLFLAAKFVPTFESWFGMHGLFYLYSTISVFVGITCVFIIPETKGMTLEEIEEMYTPRAKETSKSSMKTAL